MLRVDHRDCKMFKILFALLSVLVQVAFSSRVNVEVLAKPVKEKCISRPREFTIDGQNYFFSDHHSETKGKEVSWLEARNICRKYCMDTISIVSQEEFNLVKATLEEFRVGYIWTSGHVCDKPACDHGPSNAWFWTDNNLVMAAANGNPPGWLENPWSQTGFKKLPQPDNAEFEINRKHVSSQNFLLFFLSKFNFYSGVVSGRST